MPFDYYRIHTGDCYIMRARSAFVLYYIGGGQRVNNLRRSFPLARGRPLYTCRVLFFFLLLRNVHKSVVRFRARRSRQTFKYNIINDYN